MFSKDIEQRLYGHDCGSAIGKGWLPLVEELNKKIAAIDPEYTLHQIKEKFGGLRYYLQVSVGLSEQQKENISALVRTAENHSLVICEDCGAGNPVKVSKSGWIKTLCGNCFVGDADKLGRIDIVHNDSEKKEKIQALIDAVKNLRIGPTELGHQLEGLIELAKEAEAALKGLHVPILNVVLLDKLNKTISQLQGHLNLISETKNG